jgi:enamine deaminase RidA (YjgF/YER057c/UK114 family)
VAGAASEVRQDGRHQVMDPEAFASVSERPEAHVVANGASELFIEVFEERGARACSALGVSRIPFGCCVEIEMIVETFVSESECEL